MSYSKLRKAARMKKENELNLEDFGDAQLFIMSGGDSEGEATEPDSEDATEIEVRELNGDHQARTSVKQI